MILLENVRLAFHNLKANPLRSFLILIGMAVGIGAVLHVVVLGEMTQRRINERLEALGSNVLRIRPSYSHRRGVRTGANVVNLKWKEAEELADQSEVILGTVPIYSEQGGVLFEDQNWVTRITGTTPGYQFVNNEHPIEGRFFNRDELNRRARVCLLGATVHKKLFGNQSPIGKSILIKSKRFTVIGLLRAKGESW
ncbi:MAG: ABC transporter permease, partial [Nitrospiria bacterium]